MKEQFNLKKVKNFNLLEIKVGDLVWMNIHRRTKSLDKGALHWEGPCTIVSKSLGGVYLTWSIRLSLAW